MRTLLTLLLLICCTIMYSQSYEKIIEGYLEHIKSLQNFEVAMTYKVYKTHTSKDAIESMNGLSASSKKNLYTEIGPTEFFVGDDRSVKVSNKQKMILVTNSNMKQDVMSSSFSAEQLSYFTPKRVEDKGTFWSCYLVPNNVKETPNPVELHISKKDYSLKKQIVYFSKAIQGDYENQDQKEDKQQRLEISFLAYKPISPLTKQKLSLEHYVKLKGNDYIPVGSYKGYEIYATISNLN